MVRACAHEKECGDASICFAGPLRRRQARLEMVVGDVECAFAYPDCVLRVRPGNAVAVERGGGGQARDEWANYASLIGAAGASVFSDAAVYLPSDDWSDRQGYPKVRGDRGFVCFLSTFSLSPSVRSVQAVSLGPPGVRLRCSACRAIRSCPLTARLAPSSLPGMTLATVRSLSCSSHRPQSRSLAASRDCWSLCGHPLLTPIPSVRAALFDLIYHFPRLQHLRLDDIHLNDDECSCSVTARKPSHYPRHHYNHQQLRRRTPPPPTQPKPPDR